MRQASFRLLRTTGISPHIGSKQIIAPVNLWAPRGEDHGQARRAAVGDGIENVDLKSALEERYLAYALSTIMHRALPDARDGLKPVHRRILHAMRLLRLDPGRPSRSRRRVVGEVMGKFHPHGDQAIYDAMVRLAQDFAQRYPLVDGQGNFGKIDGDNPPPIATPRRA